MDYDIILMRNYFSPLHYLLPFKNLHTTNVFKKSYDSEDN